MTETRRNLLSPINDALIQSSTILKEKEFKNTEERNEIIKIAKMFHDKLADIFGNTKRGELSVAESQTLINNIMTIAIDLYDHRDSIDPTKQLLDNQECVNAIYSISHIFHQPKSYIVIFTKDLMENAISVIDSYKLAQATPAIKESKRTPSVLSINPIATTTQLDVKLQLITTSLVNTLKDQFGYDAAAANKLLREQIGTKQDALIKLINAQKFSPEQINAIANQITTPNELKKNGLFSETDARKKLEIILSEIEKYNTTQYILLKTALISALKDLPKIKPMMYVVENTIFQKGETTPPDQLKQIANILIAAIPSDSVNEGRYITLLADLAIARRPLSSTELNAIDTSMAAKIMNAITELTSKKETTTAPTPKASPPPQTHPTTTIINTVKAPQADKGPQKTLTGLMFANSGEASDFIKRRRNLLIDMRALFTGFGFIKDFAPHYQNLQKIQDDLLAAKSFLDNQPIDSAAPAQGELDSALHLATKFKKTMDDALIAQEKQPVKGLKQIPSFGDHSEVFDKPKGNPDKWLEDALSKTYTEQQKIKGGSKLKLSIAGSMSELKHWTENIGDDTYRKTTIDGSKKDEALAEFYESINSKTKELVSETRHIATELKTENIILQSLKSMDLKLADAQLTSFSKQLADYLHENRLKANDQSAIAQFFKDTPNALIDQCNIAPQLAKDINATYASRDYLDKIDTIALATVNSLLAVNKNISGGPIYINEAYSFDAARHVVVAIELWNRNNPSHKINYIENTDYNVSDYYRRNAKQLELDITALDQRINQVTKAVADKKGDDLNSPLAKLASKLGKAADKYGSAEAYRERVSPQTAAMAEQEAQVHSPKAKR